MKKQLLLPIGILACSWLIACNEGTNESTTSDTTSTSMTTTETTAGSRQQVALSETETYTDLKTGKTFRIRRDASSGNYVTESGEPLDDMYYLNPNTRDTFYGSSGRWVNNALIYNPDHTYSIDESRIQQPSGDGSMMMGDDAKVKMTDEELKIKSADGENKIKITDEETKIKSGDSKYKSNEDETKIKTDDVKIKSNEKGTKIKPND